ncbi:helix-turn-helix domain-containing protein [Paenibacillus sp. HWE-109]|uniref:helix-turn-helix domain-containing protein n=1 Tax=Paenibacillus sp. HWE-109 TaxID=1306526 RepID=UPI001EDD524A|nr:helix-turn-helix domain-containing protein [Paenibacillus sp. HWE-109]UKS25008.1 helix-turn-helix domain-containing protein [Paenibacillus sp. HWE-109]
MKIEDLPEVLEVADIKTFLGISKTAAYELVNSKAFHVVKIGRTYKIPKKAFAEWFEGKRD